MNSALNADGSASGEGAVDRDGAVEKIPEITQDVDRDAKSCMDRRTEKTEDELKGTACGIACMRCTFASFEDKDLGYDPRTLLFEGKILELLPGKTLNGLPQTTEGARIWAGKIEKEDWCKAYDLWGGFSFNLARTKVMDEVMLAWAFEGSGNQSRAPPAQRQLVMLGAGLDFRARRHANLLGNGVTVFELDLANMIGLRNNLMEQVAFPDVEQPGAAPIYHAIPIDFNTQDLDTVLVERGFDAALPTLFVWEGVTYYLEPDAVMRTLELIRKTSSKTELVFDYLDAAVPAGTAPPAGEKMRKMFEKVVKEPLIWGMEFKDAEEFCGERGFEVVRHWQPADFVAGGYLGKAVQLAPSPFFAILHMKVAV